MAVIPPFSPQDPIPNNPFYSPLDYSLYSGTGGRVDFGSNFFIDYSTGTLYIAPSGPNNGTVRRVSAGTGLETSPAGGVVVTGSVSLRTFVSLIPGSFTYPTISVDPYGHIYAAFSGITPLQTLVATAPLQISGTDTSKNISIAQASTTDPGAVALSNSVTDQSTNKALTSQAAFNLAQQINYFSGNVANQVYGGTVNGATGLVDSISFAGSTYPGITLGSPLPAAAPVLDGLYFYISIAGNYTAPGGTSVPVVRNDKVLCVGNTWEVIFSGYRAVAATTTTHGETTLATVTDTQALSDNTKVVTPFSLSGMIASTFQLGFVQLATNLETSSFLSSVKAVTPANLGSLSASTTARGVVLLSDSYFDPSVSNAPTANALRLYYSGAFDNTSTVVARGDLIAGLSASTPSVLPLGPNSSQLVVDISKTLGLDWNIPDSITSWPVGAVIWYLNFDVTKTPEPWLPCDGRLLDASLTGPYFTLYDLIGTTYNDPGDPAGFFRLPDLRGEFVRGWSGSTQPPIPGQTPAAATALDPLRLFASNQTSAYLQHDHGVCDGGHCMPMPLTQHRHTTNSATIQHFHGTNGGFHCHIIGSGFPISEVGGGNDGLYDGNANQGTGGGTMGAAFTNVGLASNGTGLAIDNQVTGFSPALLKTTGVTVNNSPPTAPFPNETRPYNVGLIPIIKYSFVPSGIPPMPPPLPTPTYTLSTAPTSAVSGNIVATQVVTTGTPSGTALYWEMSGPGVTSAFFNSGSLTGTVLVDPSGLSTFTNTLATILPGSGPYTLSVKLYTDAARTLQVGNTPVITVTQSSLVPVYSVATSPASATEDTVVSTTVTTSSVTPGTTLYWSVAGVSVTSAFFVPATLVGTTTVGAGGVATFSNTLASSLPPGGPYEVFVRVYSDAARTLQVGNAQAFQVTPAVVTTTPTLGVYIDLYQYRNTGGVYPDGSYVGLNPNMRATNINTVLPSLDWFYMLAEVQVFSDGKLYFGTNQGNSAALVLDAAGTTWANNTGSISGGYVSPTNPDYAYSAYALKNSVYYLSQQSAWATQNFILSLGGYNLSQFMDQAGSNTVLAQEAADQIAALITLTGAVGVDLDYEPVGQQCIPANMALLCQKIQAAVKALNASYEVHLTLIPPLSQTDPDLKVATAVACEAYVDQINVMTYDDPNALNQPPYQPGNVQVLNHTGVSRSVQSVQWFIDGGVSPAKLGMGIAGYGRNSASGQAFTNSGTPYDQIVRAAGALGAAAPEFVLGRYSGSVPIINSSPTTQANYYNNPTNALWGFDSIGTITDKVQSSSNMGLRSVFMWQLSNDYSDPTSVQPAGNPLANFALIKGAQIAIANL